MEDEITIVPSAKAIQLSAVRLRLNRLVKGIIGGDYHFRLCNAESTIIPNTLLEKGKAMIACGLYRQVRGVRYSLKTLTYHGVPVSSGRYEVAGKTSDQYRAEFGLVFHRVLRSCLGQKSTQRPYE